MAVGCAAGADGGEDPSEAEPTAPNPLPDIWDDLFGGSEGTDEGSGEAEKPDPVGWATGPSAAQLPQVSGPCPDLVDGYVNVMGANVALTVGSQPGPLVFYWHGTGTFAGEVELALPGATLDVKLSGGIVASFEDSSGTGDATGNLVWFTGDLLAADQIVACGLEAGLVDPARIYTSGYSAGGLQAGTMVFGRSNYLAAAVVYSGGPALGGLVPGSTWFDDPSHIPAVLGAHGAPGSDWLVLDFYDGTRLVEDSVVGAGGFAVDCDDGGDHAIAWVFTRAGVNGMAWQFLKDHPYGAPSPYQGGLPLGFPSYCTIVR